MCLDGLRKWKLCQSPFIYVSLARMEKRGRNQFFLPRHTAKLSIIPSPFGMPLQNFIWEHKIYYCTCKSICLISHQRTDPTVEYSHTTQSYLFVVQDCTQWRTNNGCWMERQKVWNSILIEFLNGDVTDDQILSWQCVKELISRNLASEDGYL